MKTSRIPWKFRNSRRAADKESRARGTAGPILQSAAVCRCGAPISGQRCAHGHQAPRVRGVAYLHGAYAESALESLAALGAIADKRAALCVHHGGDQSVIEQDLSGDYARYDVLISTVAANVERMGVLTARGRTRSSVGLLISLMRERQRLGTLLGLQPRQKEADIRDWFTDDDGATTRTTQPATRAGTEDTTMSSSKAATTAANAPTSDAAATFESAGRAFVEFVRYEHHHAYVTEQDAARTISFRSEETVKLRALEAEARRLANAIIDDGRIA